MTSKSCWKSFERVVAAWFGVKRTPLSGGSSAHTRADIIHNKLFVECKLRKKFALWNLFEKTRTLAHKEAKIPVVAIKKKGCKGWLMLIDPEDLIDICEANGLTIETKSSLPGYI